MLWHHSIGLALKIQHCKRFQLLENTMQLKLSLNTSLGTEQPAMVFQDSAKPRCYQTLLHWAPSLTCCSYQAHGGACLLEHCLHIIRLAGCDVEVLVHQGQGVLHNSLHEFGILLHALVIAIPANKSTGLWVDREPKQQAMHDQCSFWQEDGQGLLEAKI